MKRISAFAGTAMFLLLAPGVVAGLGPWWISRWRMHPPCCTWPGCAYWAGCCLPPALPRCLTPLPVLPSRGWARRRRSCPQHRAVTGLYRHVRNPMYVGVAWLIFGQGLLLGDARLLVYGILVWPAFHSFVRIYEEPTLARACGAEYQRFCASVPRWIPRVTRWRSGTAGRAEPDSRT